MNKFKHPDILIRLHITISLYSNIPFHLILRSIPLLSMKLIVFIIKKEKNLLGSLNLFLITRSSQTMANCSNTFLEFYESLGVAYYS